MTLPLALALFLGLSAPPTDEAVTLELAPDAVILLDMVPARLEDFPEGARVDVVKDKDGKAGWVFGWSPEPEPPLPEPYIVIEHTPPVSLWRQTVKGTIR